MPCSGILVPLMKMHILHYFILASKPIHCLVAKVVYHCTRDIVYKLCITNSCLSTYNYCCLVQQADVYLPEFFLVVLWSSEVYGSICCSYLVLSTAYTVIMVWASGFCCSVVD